MQPANDDDWVEGSWDKMHRTEPAKQPCAYGAGYYYRERGGFKVEYMRKKPSKWGKVLPFTR